MVWAALTFLTQIPKAEKSDKAVPMVVQVVRVSGTVRKAEEEAIRRARKMMARACREEKAGDESGGALLEDMFGSGGAKGKEETYQSIESDGEDEDSE